MSRLPSSSFPSLAFPLSSLHSVYVAPPPRAPFYFLLFFHWRQLLPPVEDQPRKRPRAPEARDEHARLGDGAEKPAEIIFVGPIGDAHLVAGEKPSAAPMQWIAGR